jgi:hypothetical protein
MIRDRLLTENKAKYPEWSSLPKSHTNLDILSETLRVPRGVAFCISKISPFFQWIFSEFPTV